MVPSFADACFAGGRTQTGFLGSAQTRSRSDFTYSSPRQEALGGSCTESATHHPKDFTMAKLSKSIVIVGAKRTAFGTMQGALKGISANDLAVHAAKAALAQSGVSPEA